MDKVELTIDTLLGRVSTVSCECGYRHSFRKWGEGTWAEYCPKCGKQCVWEKKGHF